MANSDPPAIPTTGGPHQFLFLGRPKESGAEIKTILRAHDLDHTQGWDSPLRFFVPRVEPTPFLLFPHGRWAGGLCVGVECLYDKADRRRAAVVENLKSPSRGGEDEAVEVVRSL